MRTWLIKRASGPPRGVRIFTDLVAKKLITLYCTANILMLFHDLLFFLCHESDIQIKSYYLLVLFNYG